MSDLFLSVGAPWPRDLLVMVLWGEPGRLTTSRQSCHPDHAR
ncbi:hypothetical protein [Kribbella sp. VKM Ac-2568]|nr:hypothetical protein [Kribbella sp. VKM Ac-2568]